MTSEHLEIEALDGAEIAKLDRTSLEKLLADLDASERRIREENVDRQTAIAKLQFQVTDESGKLPQIGHFTKIVQGKLTRLEVEDQLVEDVRALRPLCDRVNSASKQLYDLLSAYLLEVARIEKLQKGTDHKAEFLLRVEPGDLPTIEHREGSNKFELKSIDASAYQRQNRTSAFEGCDFGFGDHQYRTKN
jgi:hypothetical protein